MSSRSVRRLILTALVIGLAACTLALPTPTQPPQTQTLSVFLDPVLTWLEPALAACAAAQPDLSVLRSDGSADADLSILLGPPPEDRDFSAVLGTDQLAIVVHPSNPIEELSAVEVARLFTTEAITWQDVYTEGSNSPVEALVYPTGSTLHQQFLTALSEIDRLDNELLMIPSPSVMREEVAGRPNAIGLLPTRWLDDTVKWVNLTGLSDTDALTLPIIASAGREPQGSVRAWLLCIQDILQPTIST